MLHEVRLPEITRKRLTDVVVLQVWLLFYAASKPSLSDTDKGDCARQLNKCPRFAGRAAQITNWLWDAESRWSHLRTLSQSSAATPFEKKKFIQTLSREIFGLLKNSISTIPTFNSQADWEIAIADFFKFFYTDILRQSPKTYKLPPTSSRATVGFPPFIFSEQGATQFGAQEFLKAFRAENRNEVTICPACDEAPYSISAGSVYVNSGERKIEADIDHYLPKDLYPHLACHPYNLVPTCPTCNQRKKKTKDPLQRQASLISSRRNLHDIYVPYRQKGLAESTYLEIDLRQSFREPIILSLKERTGLSLRENLHALKEIYGIPEGWQEICDTQAEDLFKDLRDLLETHDSPFDNPELIDWFDECLHRLLRKWGLDEYAILRTWLLVSYILEAESVFDDSGNKVGNTPLLQELETLCGFQNTECSSQLLAKPTVRQRIQEASNWRKSFAS